VICRFVALKFSNAHNDLCIAITSVTLMFGDAFLICLYCLYSKGLFTEYKILIWQFFSLSILRIIFHLAFMFQRGIQPSIPTGLYYICNILFFSCCFQDTLFIFGFQQFEYHMGFCWQGKSLAVISSCIFSAAFFLSSPSNYTSIILLCNII